MELVIASVESDPNTEIGTIDMEQLIHMEIEIEE